MHIMNHKSIIGQPGNIFMCSVCGWDKPPFSFVRGQDSTMWDIVQVSPQGQISVCKSPFPSAGTAVSLFRAKMIH